jgi:ABC-type Na+ efflux pump permease subunit
MSAKTNALRTARLVGGAIMVLLLLSGGYWIYAERRPATVAHEGVANSASESGDAARRQAAEAEARLKAETEAKAKAEAEAQQKAEVAARAKAEADAKAKAEAQQNAAAQAQADAAPKTKADAETAEAALNLSPLDRMRVQVALKSAGFDTNGIDGVLGAHSRAMIQRWQQARHQPATGYLTLAQQQALLREAAPALAKWEDERKAAEAAAKARANRP